MCSRLDRPGLQHQFLTSRLWSGGPEFDSRQGMANKIYTILFFFRIIERGLLKMRSSPNRTLVQLFREQVDGCIISRCGYINQPHKRDKSVINYLPRCSYHLLYLNLREDICIAECNIEKEHRSRCQHKKRKRKLKTIIKWTQPCLVGNETCFGPPFLSCRNLQGIFL